MAYLLLFSQNIIAFLFLSTSVSKIKEINSHMVIVKEYEIIPLSLVKIFSWISVLLEFSVGIFLLVGIIPKLALLAGLLLLIIYTIAIAINLLKGRSTISCGCGGIIGDQNLSWKLVIRNLIFIVYLLFLFDKLHSLNIFSNPHSLISLKKIFITASSATILLIGSILNYLFKINHSISALLKGGDGHV